MAPKSVTDEKKVLQNFTEYRDSPGNSRVYEMTLKQDIDIPCVKSDIGISELTAGIFNFANRDPYTITKPHPTSRTIFDSLLERSQTPPELSPSSSASTTSSPGSTSNVWDSPVTPCRGLNKTFKIEAITPITPPTMCSMTTKQKFVLTPSRSPTIKSTTFDRTEALIATPSNQKIEGDTDGQEPDNFTPKKLIRGLTAQFLAITQANATAAQGRYNLRPSLNFTTKTTTHITVVSPQSLRNKTEHVIEKDSAKGRVKIQNKGGEDGNNAMSCKTPLRTGFEALLEHTVPWTVHARLKDRASQCVASLVKDQHQRCPSRAKGPLTLVDQIFRRLAKCTEEHDYRTFLVQVDELVQAAQCGTHKNASNKRLTELRALTPDLVHATKEKDLIVSRWMEAISNPQVFDTVQQHEPRPKEAHVATTRSSTARAIRRPTPEVKNDADVRLSYALNFSPYQPKWQIRLSVQEALRSLITEPLKPTDEKDGFIYIFWDFQHFGMAKIGRTDNLARRLKQWNNSCKREHSYHGELPKIPHVSRIERLIHIELKERRMQRKCEGCPKIHQEWFNVSNAHAVKVFRKWQEWIEQRPYAWDPKSAEWTLRPEMQDTLEQVCQPVEEVTEMKPLTARRKSGGAPKKSKNSRARKTM